jgi:hypothetical protein
MKKSKASFDKKILVILKLLSFYYSNKKLRLSLKYFIMIFKNTRNSPIYTD